jgi:large subunit ribosomal protein L25
MEAILDAVKRSSRGKNEARRLRVAGQIPAVVYGAQKAGDAVKNIPVAVDPKPLMRILHSGSGVNTLITLKVEGDGDSRVLVKQFLVDPITSQLLHADFYRVNMDKKITVTVQVIVKGEPRGVKVEGGVLDFVHREIELETLPADIPSAIEIDVSNLGLNDAIHVRDVAAGQRWTAISEPDMMLVHVIMPRVVEEPAAADAAAVVAAPGAAAEPEVIKKGKTEKEGDDAAAKDKKDKK